MDAREALIERSLPFLAEVKDLTPGPEVERWLNSKYGATSELYRALADLVKAGVEQGWAASTEIGGNAYRRSRIADPSDRTFHFSITVVYMDSTGNRQGHADGRLRGQFHRHPYGEFNLVVPVTADAAMNGPSGWCSGGWTAPPPGSEHYPEARGGAVIALFFLPAGRISYHDSPPE
jgi:hypothetical protein